ncbi:head-tail connector protein [Myroides sp. JBRI-B21084]|uniref:head-tail connector protein n=1 Tax=Myroides sp. JBRI-B21084 TaxID=3119977 RepID=UPI0026E3E4AF|nr:head-tail connector protein [Paenimyroides cloacae]WKW47265.1 head-tail connector protein [Paenimyroides cloacae]
MSEEINIDFTEQLVPLNFVKKHLKVEENYTDDDELIQMYIDSAIEQVVNFTERPLAQQTTIFTTNKFQDFIFERKALNDEVEKIEYQQTAEAEILTFPSTSYSVVKQGVEHYKISFKETPEAVKVQIFIKQGYTNETLPKVIKQAICLLVADAYERRENGQVVNVTKVKSIIQSFRKWQT